MITDDAELKEVLNDHYINIVFALMLFRNPVARNLPVWPRITASKTIVKPLKRFLQHTKIIQAF